MVKLTVLLGLIIFQTADLAGAASYLLHLQNGNALQTSYYWEEGDEIKFYVSGGVAGIPKGFVTKVTVPTLNYKEDSRHKEDIAGSQNRMSLIGEKLKESTWDSAGESESNSARNIGRGEAVDFDYYRQRKAALRGKLEDALQRNREATAGKDQAARERTRKEYLDFSKQIIALGDELKKRNNDVLPDWWEE